jgi:hypothetical protein
MCDSLRGREGAAVRGIAAVWVIAALSAVV